MSEEEQKALELLKEIADIRSCTTGDDLYETDAQVLLHLIKKQQKEIEEKNCLIDVLQHRIEELLDNKKEINYIKPIDIPVHNYISEDKIREKIKELESLSKNITMQPSIYNYEIDLLEELLEEN